MKRFILLFSLSAFLALPGHAKLLDKIAGVINDKVYTLSEIKRIQNTLAARKEISPLIYSKQTYTEKEILKLLHNMFIIKDKLSELGFVVSDDSVESRINETERRLGLKREDLLNFLDTKGITFNEYFELIREAMEYNIFNSRIIAPLINITDQEIKNYYYSLKSSNQALSFNYDLVDFYLPEDKIIESEKKQMPAYLEEYQKTGNLPATFRDIETAALGRVSGEDLPKDLSQLLKETDEGAFSNTYEKDGLTHVFFVKSKDLTESQNFLKMKDQIYNELFLKRSEKVIDGWFSREAFNYYILENI
ncbi:MAG: hypothetical protein WEB87_02525 [Bacteriovoracaceae bacterium]